MIFCSKNEDGESAWELVLDRRKTVTRRKEPKVVGKTYAIQPNRGVPSVGRIEVTGCCRDQDWINTVMDVALENRAWYGRPGELPPFKEEARKEGFKSWKGLCAELKRIYGDPIPPLYRIEFKKFNQKAEVGR